MKLIAGLGNPGEKYENTRHNIGFMALEQFLKDTQTLKDTVWNNSSKFKADIAEITWQPKHATAEKILLLKPKTFMNNSGMAVRIAADFYKIEADDIWIVHDDVDLQLGQLRIRKGGGSAGHRGIESLLEVFPKGDFWRFRMGIGRPTSRDPQELVGEKGVDTFVLGNFDHQEHAKVRELLKRASKAIQMGLEAGLEASMNKFNSK